MAFCRMGLSAAHRSAVRGESFGSDIQAPTGRVVAELQFGSAVGVECHFAGPKERATEVALAGLLPVVGALIRLPFLIAL